MKSSRLIAFNTFASYAHSLVALVVGLFSARWILHAMGTVDFGLFGVVGSIILLITFLNGGLSVGVSRFYAFSIGKGKLHSPEESRDDLSRWFNTAFSTHLVLALIVALVGFPIGEYVIRTWLNIPGDRLDACLTVFRFSMLTGLFSILSVPFTALFSAHQAIAELAVFSTIYSLAVLGLSWNLLSIPGDRLVFYAFGMTAISVGVGTVQIIRALRKFKACRLNPAYFFNKDRFKSLFSYVGWKMFGISCVVSRNQGVPILTNLFFGPTVNAAYSIANRLSIQATALSSSLINAFQPAIVAAEGKGDTGEVVEMCNRVCRLGSLSVLVFIIPLALEINIVLKVWLGTPPPFTAILCQWLLGMLILDKMTAGHMIAVNARGKIAIYEIIQGITFLVALPLMWLFHRAGMSADSIGLAFFISGGIYCVGRILFARFLTGFPIRPWVRTVGFPVLTITTASVIGGMFAQRLFAGELSRTIVTAFFSASIAGTTGLFLLVSATERTTLFRRLSAVLPSFPKRTNNGGS